MFAIVLFAWSCRAREVQPGTDEHRLLKAVISQLLESPDAKGASPAPFCIPPDQRKLDEFVRILTRHHGIERLQNIDALVTERRVFLSHYRRLGTRTLECYFPEIQYQLLVQLDDEEPCVRNLVWRMVEIGSDDSLNDLLLPVATGSEH